jgi:hypothetical protein
MLGFLMLNESLARGNQESSQEQGREEPAEAATAERSRTGSSRQAANALARRFTAARSFFVAAAVDHLGAEAQERRFNQPIAQRGTCVEHVRRSREYGRRHQIPADVQKQRHD